MIKCYEKTEVKQNLNYQNMFWLFMIANITGVVLEGICTFQEFGRWETHVNTIWGPFCLIYGVGAVSFYFASVILQNKHPFTQFLTYALIGDFVEYYCAWILEKSLDMKAWTYNEQFMNIQGRISLKMTVVWGIVGITYVYLLIPRFGTLFSKLHGRIFRIACIVLTVYMVIDIGMTVLCLHRWSTRHQGKAPANQIEQVLDRRYNDQFMSKKFCEWWFVDEQQEFYKEYVKR